MTMIIGSLMKQLKILMTIVGSQDGMRGIGAIGMVLTIMII